MTAAGVPPLAGFTVGITAARRADELAALLVRRGASVLHGPAIRIVPLADDTELLAATERLLERPVDVVVATTGIGFRGWMEAADGWGLAGKLLRRLESATVMARGPKARGAVRAAGLMESWTPGSETNAELLDHLIESGVDGRAVAVQLHGDPLTWFVDRLRAAGADVVPIPVYRWTDPTDTAPLDRLLDHLIGRQMDAITFTSAPAAVNLLAHARRTGRLPAAIETMQNHVMTACVGAVSAIPLLRSGIPLVQPERPRIGSLARRLAEELPTRAVRLRCGRHCLEVRGQAALIDGELRPVPPAPMALLRKLAANPGAVVSRRDLLAALPTGGAEHAVESAMARLRSALGEPQLVRTVVKRGYQLRLDPTVSP